MRSTSLSNANDYCVSDRTLAAYFETDWSDFFQHKPESLAERPRSLTSSMSSNSSVKAANAILSAIEDYQVRPKSLLEIGPGLGRTLYELCVNLQDIEKVKVFEPSPIFFDHLLRILHGNVKNVPVIKNAQELFYVPFNCRKIVNIFSASSIDLVNSEMKRADLAAYDLVLCLNVLDQCGSPMQLLKDLKNSVRTGGLLCVSCTYQWPSKHLNVGESTIEDLCQCFGSSWEIVDEVELDYSLRLNHRCRYVFDSHLVIVKKLSIQNATSAQ